MIIEVRPSFYHTAITFFGVEWNDAAKWRTSTIHAQQHYGADVTPLCRIQKAARFCHRGRCTVSIDAIKHTSTVSAISLCSVLYCRVERALPAIQGCFVPAFWAATGTSVCTATWKGAKHLLTRGEEEESVSQSKSRPTFLASVCYIGKRNTALGILRFSANLYNISFLFLACILKCHDLILSLTTTYLLLEQDVRVTRQVEGLDWFKQQSTVTEMHHDTPGPLPNINNPAKLKMGNREAN